MESIKNSSENCQMEKDKEEKKTKYFFYYSKVLFGELIGKLTSAVKVCNNSIFITMKCNQIRKPRNKEIMHFNFSLRSSWTSVARCDGHYPAKISIVHAVINVGRLGGVLYSSVSYTICHSLSIHCHLQKMVWLLPSMRHTQIP